MTVMPVPPFFLWRAQESSDSWICVEHTWCNCKIKLSWNGQGIFVASANDRTSSIRLFQNKPRDYPLSSNAVCLLRPLWTACGATQAGCGVELAVRLLQRTSTPQSQAQSNRRSYWVASIIERIDLGCASNLMRGFIRLTAPFRDYSLLRCL